MSRAVWERRRWDDQAEAALGDLIDGDRQAVLEDLEDGRAELWRARGPGYEGWLITRVEAMRDGGRELVLIAGRGRGMAAVMLVLREAARRSGCRRIRAHSHRPGYARFVAGLGFREVERVFVLDLEAHAEEAA